MDLFLSASEEVEDNAQTVGMDPESVSSTQDSTCKYLVSC